MGILPIQKIRTHTTMALNYIQIRKECIELYSPYSGGCFNGTDIPEEPETDPKEISALLNIDGGVIFECNDGWNGLIWFAFAPTE